MLSKLLEGLEKALKNYKIKLTDNQIQSLSEILDFYSGGVIPMRTVRRELNLSMDETEDLMIYLETKGILKSAYKVYCPDKSECIREEIYDDVRDIPKAHCDKCDERCIYLKNIIVVFKVV
ncbi:hypothetical protein FDE98_02360 [Clostridium sporogenes]|uniref:Uncharacterized protein n=1 Tax=Clostridium sporogenes TaxID=1509 RepID=A0A7X5P6U3_CLOSG|nr:hypothetical protein [Clostridium sporogenes]MBY7016676.1 hypothetical protein [Clostridium sporogenes]NFQ17014.1 hypothetical protein [Clostridium sporogenes]NFQ21091.1 hypothetical protein [Clostridium sporogenes]NFQ27553.1 hypothetical protein [Clostridium sporogenes]NFR36399.1 hypothetical protein [Clostridium sporogenes]